MRKFRMRCWFYGQEPNDDQNDAFNIPVLVGISQNGAYSSQFVAAARLDVGYNHGVESMFATFAVDGWQGRLREDMYGHARHRHQVATLEGLGLDSRRMERFHTAIKHLDSQTHTLLAPRAARDGLRTPATCMAMPLAGVDEALLRASARISGDHPLTINEAEVALSPERLLGVVAGTVDYTVTLSSSHSGDPGAVRQPLPASRPPSRVSVPGAVVVNVTLHTSEASPAGIEAHLILAPAGTGAYAPSDEGWPEEAVHGLEHWVRWRGLLEAQAESDGRAALALASWRGLVGSAGPCLRFLPPLVALPPDVTGGNGSAGLEAAAAVPQRRRHAGWGAGLPEGLVLGGSAGWNAAAASRIARPHAVVDVSDTCRPVAMLAPRFEAVIADFETLPCGDVWSDAAIPQSSETQAQAHRHGIAFGRDGNVEAVDGRPVRHDSQRSEDVPDSQDAGQWEHPCLGGEGRNTSLRLCQSVLLRQLVSAKAWSPHEQVGYECDPMG